MELLKPEADAKAPLAARSRKETTNDCNGQVILRSTILRRKLPHPELVNFTTSKAQHLRPRLATLRDNRPDAAMREPKAPSKLEARDLRAPRLLTQARVEGQSSAVSVARAGVGANLARNLLYQFNRLGSLEDLPLLAQVFVRSSWAGLELREPGALLMIIGAGVLWVLGCLYLAKVEVLEMATFIQKSNKLWYQTLAQDYAGFWNCVDWLAIIMTLVICGSFGLLHLFIGDVNYKLGQIVADVDANGYPPVQVYRQSISDFADSVVAMLDVEGNFRFWLCIYPVVLLMRLFKSFAAQKRLAIVTDTFSVAYNDLMHFFVVFLSVYFCMTVNAVIFFGQELSKRNTAAPQTFDMLDFATIDRALHACFRAMLGDWDWEAMGRIGIHKAFAWFFSFMLVMVMVLLNMLVAILMEAYGVVKDDAKNADSLFQQTRNILRRAQQTKRKERVKLSDIWDALLKEHQHNEATSSADVAIEKVKALTQEHSNEMADGIATILGEEMQELEKRQRLGPKAVGCTLALGPSAPAAILRYESGGKAREGTPIGGQVTEILSLAQTAELLEQVAKEEVPCMDSGTLSELWTLQSYVEPRYGIRIISVYSCDAHLEERSDIFSHRFRPVYQPSTTALEETSPDGPVELETPYRQAIESKTLGIEFVFDLQGQIVLHGCWAISLCTERGARRFRCSTSSTGPTPRVVWREQKAFDVPKLGAPVKCKPSRNPFVDLASKMAEKMAAGPLVCELLLEFWQADTFLGEAFMPCQPNNQSELRVVRLLATTTSPRSDGRKLLTTEVDPKAVAVVSGGPVLRGEAEDTARSERLQSPHDHVCGAEFAAHWGMSAEGALCGHQLAQQVAQRFKLGRNTRSGLLKSLAERVGSFHQMQKQWEIFVETMKVKHHEAVEQLRFQEKRFGETNQKYSESVEAFHRSLAAGCRRLCDEDLEEATKVKRRIEGEQQKLLDLDQQQAHFQTSLDLVRSKYNDLMAEDLRLREELQGLRERHLTRQQEALKARRQEPNGCGRRAEVELERLQQQIRSTKVPKEAVHGPETVVSLVADERRWLAKHQEFVEGWGFGWRSGVLEHEVVPD
eukprot:g8131.t1